MKTLKFKTNINCGGCVKTVTPFLEDVKNIDNWSVDTAQKDKILEVKGDQIDHKEIINAVEKAGFKAEKMQDSFLKKIFS